MDYHAIVINLSLKHPSRLKSLEIIGSKVVFIKPLVLFKIRVPAAHIENAVQDLQSDLVERILFFPVNFYFHFYRENELIIVFKHKIFRVTPDPSTWSEVIEYGRSLGIPLKQLDFLPCRVEDETF